MLDTNEQRDFVEVRRIQRTFKNAVQGIMVFVNDISPAALEHDERARKIAEKARSGIRSIVTGGKNKDKLSKEEDEKLDSAVKAIMGIISDYDVSWVNLTFDDQLHRRLLLKSSFTMIISSFDFLVSDLLQNTS
jgi:hypothetical protein